ncbi:MAG: rhomboid family intramembrane serine protease [Bacteroidetes bacterium]|nr:rhomboid family intramembrane serine protease [Bacteroidota bacterium]
MNNFLGNIPGVVKNLLIINVLMFVVTFIFAKMHIDLNRILGLYYFDSPGFKPFQIITYMFMHGGLFHILFNMYALWMFGSALENVWGPKRFLIYYMITGVGAGLIQILVAHIRLIPLYDTIPPELLDEVLNNGYQIIQNNQNFIDPIAAKINLIINTTVVGASGAVFGLLLANGILFPNNSIFLMFPPISLKMKYFVLIYGGIELYAGLNPGPGDNIAHFAHLGGMLFGFILIKYWQKNA